jgi:hypothetical protein
MQETIIQSLEEDTVTWAVVGEYVPGKKYDLGAYRPHLINDYIVSEFEPFSTIDDSTVYKKK